MKTMIDTYNEQVDCVDPDCKIEVYRNLHKNCWSVRQKGIVRFHCHRINLKDCMFVVQPAGHAKVIREKKKNVHAFVRGYLYDSMLPVSSPFMWDDIYYNPYKADTFVDFEGTPVHMARLVDLDIKDETPVLAMLE